MVPSADDTAAPLPALREPGGSEQDARLVPLAPADLEACLALDAACLGGLWTAQQWSRELEDAQRPGIGLRRGPDLLAMACGWLVVDELHITLVAVDPHRRRQGLGFRVLGELLAEGHRLGAAHATLEVATDNQAAQALYARCGFRTAGVRRRYYRDGSDALIQWVRLEDGRAVMGSRPGLG